MGRKRLQPRPIAQVRLDGSRLCLNFVNTIHDRHAPVLEDYISTPAAVFRMECARRGARLTQPRAQAATDRAGGERRCTALQKASPLFVFGIGRRNRCSSDWRS